MSRTILVATDGTPAAMGALRLASELAKHRQCAVDVLGVVEPLPVFDAGFLVALPEVELFQPRQDALRQEIQGQLGELGEIAADWPVTVLPGAPGPRIVGRAEEVGAGTILLGLGRHRPLDRVFGTETALQVIRMSRVPVLAVPEDAAALPRSAAFGVDFSLFSQRAASAALAIMQCPWEAYLIHVMSGLEFLPTISEGWRVDFEEELRSRLSEFGRGLAPSGDSKVHTHLLEGEPARELLAFAEGRGVELVTAGSHGLSFVGRLLMGSVSTRLIRGARIPVLVVPPLERTEEVLPSGRSEGTAHPWVQELHDFTRANAGRRTTLQVIDPELGLQECGKNFPLWGVDFDPRRDRVNIMLGRSGTVEGHLTHSIPSPLEVQVVRGAEGRTEALHLRLERGQVILRIHRD